MRIHKFDCDIDVFGNIYKDGVLDVPCEETTYAALKAKRDAGELVPGRWYRITDFVTTVANDTEARSAGHPFDVLVMATTNKTLSEDAKAAVNVNDTNYFGQIRQVIISAEIMPGITIADVTPLYKMSYEQTQYKTPTERKREFTSLGTIVNSDGVTVPYLFEPDPDDAGSDRNYIYTGIFEFDGDTYDMWQEYDLNGVAYPYYELTNVVVNATIENKIVEKAKLSQWSLKYCLDNDTHRFSWANVAQAIINIPSGQSQGPLERQSSFDGRGDNPNYPYAWGTTADLEDADPADFIYSQTENINNGDMVYDPGSQKLKSAQIGQVGKGVIYRMIDEYNNNLPYDFKNVQFKRYYVLDNEQGAVINHTNYDGIRVSDNQFFPFTCTIDEGAFVWRYTFTNLNALSSVDSTLTGSTKNNCIEILWDSSNLPNAVFQDGANNNRFHQVAFLTFHSLISENVVESRFFRGIFDDFTKNTIYNTVSSLDVCRMYGNTIYGEMHDCQILYFLNNTIGAGASFCYNSVKRNCEQNQFLARVSHVNVNSDFVDNIIEGNGILANSIFSNATGNRLKGDISGNNFGSNFNYNNIDCVSCANNTFGTTTQHNTMRVAYCNGNTFATTFNYNNINVYQYISNNLPVNQMNNNLIQVQFFTSNTLHEDAIASSTSFNNNVITATAPCTENVFSVFSGNHIYTEFAYNTFDSAAFAQGNIFWTCSQSTFSAPVYSSEFRYFQNSAIEASIQHCFFEHCHFVEINSNGIGYAMYVKVEGEISGSSATNLKQITAIPGRPFVQVFTPVGKTTTEVS